MVRRQGNPGQQDTARHGSKRRVPDRARGVIKSLGDQTPHPAKFGLHRVNLAAGNASQFTENLNLLPPLLHVLGDLREFLRVQLAERLAGLSRGAVFRSFNHAVIPLDKLTHLAGSALPQ